MTAAPLAVHDTGGGPAILFLHAFPLDASQWDHQVAALSDRFRCLRPDCWGCGASPAPPPGAASLDDLASAILAALDERGAQRVAVAGLSMGGYLAFALLRIAPERITALALCNTRATADGDDMRADRLRRAQQVERDDDVEPVAQAMVDRLLGPRARREAHVVDPLRGRIRRCTPAGIAWAQRAMAARPDSSAALSGIRVPTLCVAGDDDAIVPAPEVRAMAAGVGGATFVSLPCGHLSNLELPHDVSRLLGEFFDTNATATP